MKNKTKMLYNRKATHRKVVFG